MLSLHGAGIGREITIGTACVLSQDVVDTPEYRVPRSRIDDEIYRLRAAIAAARLQLIQIRQNIPAESPPEAAGFIEAHLMMLEDPMLSQAPEELISYQQINAEQAISMQSQSLIEVFEQMEDEYLSSRGDDIQQIAERIQRNLMGIEDVSSASLTEEFKDPVIVARDLAPADTMALKPSRIRAILTNLGGPISHSAILARSLGIPAVVGMHVATSYIQHGDKLIVDGRNGNVIVAPDEQTLKAYRQLRRSDREQARQLNAIKKSGSVSKDGVRVTLQANIEMPRDIRAALNANAAGIGLFRTEYLYMNRDNLPTENDHFNAYMRILRHLGKRPMTIRTLDLGSDKTIDGSLEAGSNPALGLRGIRLCLQRPALFIPQLRAILRASAHGQVRMMIPMLSSLNELHQVFDLINELKRSLRKEGTPYNSKIKIGGMVEVPAAAISADLFAPHLDFLSIGTNDLIQYALAIDRVDDEVNYLYNPLHPSVLRLIDMTVRAGDKAGIPVTMCGEMAGDVESLETLLGLGLRSLSMDPANMLEIKNLIRRTDIGATRERTHRLLNGLH
jgi:phosphotransferase system enzyme I (PtsI)